MKEKAQPSPMYEENKRQPIQTDKPIDPFCVSNTKFLSNVALSNEV